MSISFRKTLQWEVDERSFHFTTDGVVGELQTPDGQVITLSMGEWHAISIGLTELGPVAKSSKYKAAMPPNVGQPWSEELDAHLKARWTDGADVRQLAAEFGRSRGGITSRLVRLGLVPDRQSSDSRIPAVPPPGRSDETRAESS
ncbi:hypothetical protein [Microvirga massiliensis]|uniref:hypothetical protein n=1 Tax=Microvirga massiliensis TaxID=1033741 RepID=UPI000660371C|nr:hypothetical protein [Microvirga massiliensis]